MSSNNLEIIMARLYTDKEFLNSFITNPYIALKEYKLPSQYIDSLININKFNLQIAAKSYESKRKYRNSFTKKLKNLLMNFLKF